MLHSIWQQMTNSAVATGLGKGQFSFQSQRKAMPKNVQVQYSSDSHVRIFATPWTTVHWASLPITNSQSLPKLIFIELVMPSSHLILCCPSIPLSSIFLSIRVFSNESALHIRRPKYWSFSFNISPSNEYTRWISFIIDWFDLLGVQVTLKSLLYHNSQTSILQCLAFFNGPTLTCIHDYWKNHSFDNMGLCWQSDLSAF